MFFTDHKNKTLRIANAECFIHMNGQTLEAVKTKTTPKGDVLELARAAGVMAGKKTTELLPYCHPLPIDGIRVDFEILNDKIHVTSVVKTIWKTGVEMEALTAVSIAALTIYDMCKPLDKDMTITNTRLTKKKGGKTDYRENLPIGFKAEVIVTSDGTFEGTREDKSGLIIKKRLEELGILNIGYTILPDEQSQIKEKLISICNEGTPLIVTTGGTGLGPRDVTVDSTQEVIEKEIPGVAETMRNYGQERTPYSMLSRSLVGINNKTIIVNMPGSSNGARECLDAIFPALLHAYKMMGGGGH